MGSVKSIGGDSVDRPAGVALYNEIERVIEDIATDAMTPFEVVGVLNVLTQRFYDENLSLLAEIEVQE